MRIPNLILNLLALVYGIYYYNVYDHAVIVVVVAPETIF